MNVFVLGFFDKYLMEKKDINLVTQAQLYPEIELTTNVEL